MMKTMLLRKIHKLGVAYEKYEKELLLFRGSPRISFADGVAGVFEHCEVDCEYCEAILQSWERSVTRVVTRHSLLHMRICSSRPI